MQSLHNQILDTIEKIRNSPLDFNLRLQLVQYYCLTHQWEKAKRTLQQYLKLNPKDQQSQTLFAGNIECELARINVFKGRQPFIAYSSENIVVNLQQNMVANLENTQHLYTHFMTLCNEHTAEMKIKCYEQQDLDGQFIDTDIRLSHIFEIFQDNHYYVISLNEISAVHFKPTEILTDLMWRRGEVILKNQQTISCFMPVRYPVLQDGTDLDDALLHARITEWQNLDNFSIAVGQKTFTNAENDIGILDISDIYCVSEI